MIKSKLQRLLKINHLKYSLKKATRFMCAFTMVSVGQKIINSEGAAGVVEDVGKKSKCNY